MNNFHSQSNQEPKKEEAATKATSSWMDNPKLTGIDMSKSYAMRWQNRIQAKTPQELLPLS